MMQNCTRLGSRGPAGDLKGFNLVKWPLLSYILCHLWPNLRLFVQGRWPYMSLNKVSSLATVVRVCVCPVVCVNRWQICYRFSIEFAVCVHMWSCARTSLCVPLSSCSGESPPSQTQQAESSCCLSHEWMSWSVIGRFCWSGVLSQPTGASLRWTQRLPDWRSDLLVFHALLDLSWWGSGVGWSLMLEVEQGAPFEQQEELKQVPVCLFLTKAYRGIQEEPRSSWGKIGFPVTL